MEQQTEGFAWHFMPESSVALDLTRDTERGITSLPSLHEFTMQMPASHSSASTLHLYRRETGALPLPVIRPVLSVQEDSHLNRACLSLLLKANSITSAVALQVLRRASFVPQTQPQKLNRVETLFALQTSGNNLPRSKQLLTTIFLTYRSFQEKMDAKDFSDKNFDIKFCDFLIMIQFQAKFIHSVL